MRTRFGFELPTDAGIHTDVGKITFFSAGGEIEIRLTEEQMLEAIRQMLPQAIRVRASQPGLERLRKELVKLQ